MNLLRSPERKARVRQRPRDAHAGRRHGHAVEELEGLAGAPGEGDSPLIMAFQETTSRRGMAEKGRSAAASSPHLACIATSTLPAAVRTIAS